MGPAMQSVGRDMRVPVANQVVAAAGQQFAEHPAIVAVQKGDSPPGQLQLSFALVAGVAAGFHGRPQRGEVVVDVAEHEMRRPRVEQSHDFGRADVAAVDQLLDLAAFEHPHRRLDVGEVGVGVADDADSHASCRRVHDSRLQTAD